MCIKDSYYTGEAIFGLLMSGEPDDELVRVTNSLMRRSYGLSLIHISEPTRPY